MSEDVVVITNDDGISAPGLAVLAEAVRAHPSLQHLRVVVVAPSSNMSGTAAAIGPGEVDVSFRSVGAVGGVAAFEMDAPPAVAVIAGYEGHFGGPLAFVASGINAGVNIGWGVLHSGTVGAALCAQNLGVSALAVSAPPDASAGLLTHTAELGLDLVDELLAREGRHAVAANVNVVSEGPDELRTASLARAVGMTASAVGEGPASAVPIRANTSLTDDPRSDASLLAAGHPTVSYLRGLESVIPGH